MSARDALLLRGTALALLAVGCSQERAGDDPPPAAGSAATLTAAEPHYVRGLLAARDQDFVAAHSQW